jgi:hypothetical protein
MSVHLQRIRLLATTKDQADAGADSGVMLRYYVNSRVMTTSPTKGWNSQELTRPWKDRERGRTEVYGLTSERESVASSSVERPCLAGSPSLILCMHALVLSGCA